MEDKKKSDNQRIEEIKKQATESIQNLEKLCNGITSMTENMFKSMGEDHYKSFAETLKNVKADETLSSAGEAIRNAKKALNDLKF